MNDKQTNEALNEQGKEVHSHSLEMLNVVMSKSLGIAMHNAVNAQQHAQVLNAAATTSTCARILSIANISLKVPPVTPLNNQEKEAQQPSARAAKKK